MARADKRTAQVGDEMRRVLAELLQDEVKDPRVPMMTSVTDVVVTRDLGHATAYISVLGSEEELKGCIDALQGMASFLRRAIAARMTLRVMPLMHFEADRSIAHGMAMDDLIDRVMGRKSEMDEASGEDAED